MSISHVIVGYLGDPNLQKEGKNAARMRAKMPHFSTFTRTPPFRNPVSAPGTCHPVDFRGLPPYCLIMICNNYDVTSHKNILAFCGNTHKSIINTTMLLRMGPLVGWLSDWLVLGHTFLCCL